MGRLEYPKKISILIYPLYLPVSFHVQDKRTHLRFFTYFLPLRSLLTLPPVRLGLCLESREVDSREDYKRSTVKQPRTSFVKRTWVNEDPDGLRENPSIEKESSSVFIEICTTWEGSGWGCRSWGRQGDRMSGVTSSSNRETGRWGTSLPTTPVTIPRKGFWVPSVSCPPTTLGLEISRFSLPSLKHCSSPSLLTFINKTETYYDDLPNFQRHFFNKDRLTTSQSCYWKGEKEEGSRQFVRLRSKRTWFNLRLPTFQRDYMSETVKELNYRQ